MLTRHLAKRVASDHITVNAIAPGPFDSKMMAFALDDPRLSLPVPVYRLRDGSLALRSRVQATDSWENVVEAPFFALDRPGPGLVRIGEFGFGLAPDEPVDALSAHILPLFVDSSGHPTLEQQEGQEPLARVWQNPLSRLILAPEALPVR